MTKEERSILDKFLQPLTSRTILTKKECHILARILDAHWKTLCQAKDHQNRSAKR